jgi:aminoglycoside phosphotransferase (APT) family kinase protein
MQSMTKNTQTKDTLFHMTANAFPLLACTEITELSEGYFNVAYRISFADGPSCILKIAPPKEIRTLYYEKNIIESEVEAMGIVAAKTNIPVAKVLFYGGSCTLCTSPYFFMEELEGRSFSSLQEDLSEEVKKQIRIETGKINREISQITNDTFGYMGNPDLQGENWFYVFTQIIQFTIKDAEYMSIDLKISPAKLETLLNLSKPVFEAVIVPRMVHWDLWNGNIFVKDNRISGLIDWERCLWGDPLMEVGFRTYGNHEDFLTGYGIDRLSDDEYIRALWYDIYALIVVAQECDYRMYETRHFYDWSTELLPKKLEELQHALESFISR